MKKKIVLSSIATLALISLVGCGGGSTPPAEEIAKSKLSGVAVDDLIFNGLVTAKTADGTDLASGRTSETDGTYTLDVAHDGVVVMNVTCDENSTMGLTPADAVSCADQGVSLNSLADVEPGVPQTVNISPLTEIVYKRATEQAGSTTGITATEFDDSREEIGQMFGVDPIAENPAEEGSPSAAIIAAIHALADQDSTKSVIDITEQLADELANGVADGSADATVSALSGEMSESNITNNLTDNNGTYTPIAPEVLTNIEEAKALFAELRTQAMSVVDYNNSGTPGFMDTEAVDMEAALNDVTMNVGYMVDRLNGIVEAIDFMVDNNIPTLTGQPSQNRSVTVTAGSTEGTWTYVFKEDSVEKWNGTVSIPAALLGNNAKAELYTSGTLKMTVNGTVPLDYQPVVETGVTDSQSFNGTISVTKTATGADITMSGKVASNGTSIELKAADAEVAYTKGTADSEGNTQPVFNYVKLNKVELQGIVGGYTIDGSSTVNSYAQNAGLAPKGGIVESYRTYFNGQVTCSDGSSYTNGTVQVLLNGETYDLTADYSGNFWMEVDGDYTYNDLQNAVSADDAFCQTGTANVAVNYSDSWSDGGKFANSGWLPNDITFAGAISRTGASMEGTLNAKWLNAKTMKLDGNADEKPLVDVKFNGKLQVPERPKMLATLTFENNATHNTIGASYTYDSTVINLSALFDTDMNNGDIEVTTHTGLRADLKVTDGDLITDGTGKVTKDGSLVGTLEERENVPVIKYVDGSFESLP